VADRNATLALILKASGVEATNQQLKAVVKGLDELKKSSEATAKSAQETAKHTQGLVNILSKPFRMATSFLLANAVFTALRDSMFSFTDAAIGFNSTLEQAQVSFETMTGSAQLAQEHIEELAAFARKTPFDFPQILEASKRLQAYGTDVRDVTGIMRILGDIAAGVGTDKLPQLILAFGQVQTATKLTGMELRQFQEAGVPLLRTLAEQFNVTTHQMSRMVSEGKVGFDDVRQALETLTAEGSKFGGGMERQSKTFQGSVQNIKDAFDQIVAAWAGPTFIKLAEILGNIADGANKTAEKMKGRAGLSGALDDTAKAGDKVAKSFKDIIVEQYPLLNGFFALSGGIRRVSDDFGLLITRGRTVIEVLSGRAGQKVAEEQRGIMAALRQARLRLPREAPFEPYQPPTADIVAAARQNADAFAAAEKLARSGELVEAAEALHVLGVEYENAANQAVQWRDAELAKKDPIERTTAAIKGAIGATGDLVEEAVAAAHAYDLWMNSMKALVSEGRIFEVGEAFGEMGKTLEEAKDAVIALQKELDQEAAAMAGEWLKAQETANKQRQAATEFAIKQREELEKLRTLTGGGLGRVFSDEEIARVNQLESAGLSFAEAWKKVNAELAETTRAGWASAEALAANQRAAAAGQDAVEDFLKKLKAGKTGIPGLDIGFYEGSAEAEIRREYGERLIYGGLTKKEYDIDVAKRIQSGRILVKEIEDQQRQISELSNKNLVSQRVRDAIEAARFAGEAITPGFILRQLADPVLLSGSNNGIDAARRAGIMGAAAQFGQQFGFNLEDLMRAARIMSEGMRVEMDGRQVGYVVGARMSQSGTTASRVGVGL